MKTPNLINSIFSQQQTINFNKSITIQNTFGNNNSFKARVLDSKSKTGAITCGKTVCGSSDIVKF